MVEAQWERACRPKHKHKHTHTYTHACTHIQPEFNQINWGKLCFHASFEWYWIHQHEPCAWMMWWVWSYQQARFEHTNTIDHSISIAAFLECNIQLSLILLIYLINEMDTNVPNNKRKTKLSIFILAALKSSNAGSWTWLSFSAIISFDNNFFWGRY